MAATPPPAPLREPRAPRHGAGYDSFDPYPTRHSARLATQRSTDAHTTPPPPSPKKAVSRQRHRDALSPPRTLSPRKKTSREKAPLLNERLDLDYSDLSDGAGSSLHRHSQPTISLAHSGVFPTPAKTPRHKKSSTNFGSAARSLFPSDLQNSKRSKKPSGFSLDSFQEDVADSQSSIQIYTDSRDRIPTLNESLDNPFLNKPEARMPANTRAEPKRRELTSRMISSELDPKEAVKRDDGMLYTFRGKKVFRKFEEKRSGDEDENTDDELGFFAVRPDLLDSSVNLHVPRLTRSAIKGRRLFSTTPEKKQPADEISQSVDENEEATTDIEEPVDSTEGTDIVHSEGDADVPTRRSLRTRPTRGRDGDQTQLTHAAVAETKKKRGKSSSPFDVWARKKQSPADVSTGKKREADSSSALAAPAPKKTRGH